MDRERDEGGGESGSSGGKKTKSERGKGIPERRSNGRNGNAFLRGIRRGRMENE